MEEELRALGELVQEIAKKCNGHVSVFSVDGTTYSVTAYPRDFRIIDLYGGIK